MIPKYTFNNFPNCPFATFKLRNKINILIAEETGRDVEQVSKDTDRDYWLSAEEAKDYGLIEKIISERKELPN